MEEVKVSVVVPTYNRPNEVKTLLLDLYSQSKPPSEIIVVDDSTDDRVSSVVRSLYNMFTSRGIRLYYTKNYGMKKSLTVARNVGLKLSSDDSLFVVFLDDDVRLPKAYLESIINLFLEKENVVLAGAYDINEYNFIKKEMEYEKTWLKIYETIFKIFETSGYITMNYIQLIKSPHIIDLPVRFLGGCNMVLRKDKILDSGILFDENLSRYSFREDLVFSHNIYKKFGLGSVILTKRTYVRHMVSETARYYPEKSMLKWRQYVYTYYEIKGYHPIKSRLGLLRAITGELLLRAMQHYGRNTSSLFIGLLEDLWSLFKSGAIAYGLVRPKLLKDKV